MESSKEMNMCIKNCGFFGSAATMNMCSKCHKDMILKQQRVMLAASSIESIVNGSSISNEKGSVFVDVDARSFELKPASPEPYPNLVAGPNSELRAKESPNRCVTCRKRVGLTGFSCRCGNLFCSTHRYSDKHDCQFDYRGAGQNAIAKANPLVKADKLDKI